MAVRKLTTTQLVSEVRSLCDEVNSASLDTEADILPALNRAQDVAANILAKHYESPLITSKMVTLNSGQRDYPIPYDAFENRLEKIEVAIQNGIYNPVKRQNYRDATLLETPARTSIPMFYAEIGDNYRLYPGPTGGYPLRIWYMREPDPLVLERGTLSKWNPAQSWIQVSAKGLDTSVFSVEMDDPASYLSIVDSDTGAVKATLQLQNIGPNGRLSFRTVPVKSTFIGRPVSGSLPDNLTNEDLICEAGGTCVPILKKPISGYMIQMAASELMNTKLGMQNQMAEQMRQEMHRIVQESWVGRESYLKVRTANPHFQKLGKRTNWRY